MKKLSEFIFGHKKLVAICLAVLLAASAISLACSLETGGYDSDIIHFIGEGTNTRDGLAFLNANFGINGDIMIAVEGSENDKLLTEVMLEISEYEGVMELIWYGTLKETKEIFEGLNNILRLFGVKESNLYNDNGLSEYLKRPIDEGRAHYVILILTKYSPSSQEGFALLDRIEDRLSPSPVATAGMTSTARHLLRDTMQEVPYYILFSVIGMLIILLLASDSYLEPLIILAALAAAALINAGTNFIFGESSVISLAASAVLQLTITTDFALIINLIYKNKGFCKDNLRNPNLALTSTLCGSVVTAAVFCALFFIRFGLGADIAKVTIKAVIISFLSAITVVPLMNALLSKALQKTAYRRQLQNVSEKPAKFIIKYRLAIFVIAAATVAVSCFGLTNIKYSYFKIFEGSKNETQIEAVASELENQLILAVPVTTKIEGGHLAFIAELEALESVDKVIGAFSAVNVEGEVVEWVLNNTSLQDAPHISSVFRKTADGKWYTLYSVVIKNSAESPQAITDHTSIQGIMDKYFNDSYSFGLMTGVYDIKNITPKDFRNIMLVCSAILLIMCVVMLKSFKKGITVAVLTVASIIINIAIEGITSIDTNFIVYLLMCAVQTGTTLNYGMLIAVYYGENKKRRESNAFAAQNALTSALGVMLISLCVLITCSLCIFFISSNLIIKDIVKMLARGNVIGFLLMATALPSVLSLKLNKSIKIH